MGGQNTDAVVTDAVVAATATKRRSLPLTVLVAGFVAVFSLASGAWPWRPNQAGQASDGLLVLTLAGLVVFVVASVVFSPVFCAACEQAECRGSGPDGRGGGAAGVVRATGGRLAGP